jgi:DNA-binding GntR family transcriptional regulator
VRGSLRETPSRIAQGNAEHGALLEAMRRRDGDAVERILFEHLEHTLGALKEP